MFVNVTTASISSPAKTGSSLKVTKTRILFEEGEDEEVVDMAL